MPQPTPPKKDIPPWDPAYVEMQNASSIEPSLGFLQKLFGPSFMQPKRHEDIQLNPGIGYVQDPRLQVGTPERQMYMKSRGSQFDNIKEGYDILRNLGKKP